MQMQTKSIVIVTRHSFLLQHNEEKTHLICSNWEGHAGSSIASLASIEYDVDTPSADHRITGIKFVVKICAMGL